MVDAPGAVANPDLTDGRERGRVEPAEPVRPVAQDQLPVHLGEPPPLARYCKGVERGQIRLVVDEHGALAPGELVEPPVERRQPLGEVGPPDVQRVEHATRFEVHAPERRLTVQPGALVERAVGDQQALRERLRVVRVLRLEGRPDDRGHRGGRWGRGIVVAGPHEHDRHYSNSDTGGDEHPPPTGLLRLGGAMSLIPGPSSHRCSGL